MGWKYFRLLGDGGVSVRALQFDTTESISKLLREAGLKIITDSNFAPIYYSLVYTPYGHTGDFTFQVRPGDWITHRVHPITGEPWRGHWWSVWNEDVPRVMESWTPSPGTWCPFAEI